DRRTRSAGARAQHPAIAPIAYVACLHSHLGYVTLRRDTPRGEGNKLSAGEPRHWVRDGDSTATRGPRMPRSPRAEDLYSLRVPTKSADDATQVWLLPMDGGEATQLTRLPASVGELAWSPDGTRLCVTSWATSTTKTRRTREPGTPPDGDARLIDRLQYMSNG